MHALETAQRQATPDEQRLLARWSGFGAVPALFDERSKQAAQFAEERAELRSLLGEDGYRAARRSTINAHYTDVALVQAIWDAVAALGFDAGTVLEPGCGSGNFLAFAPAAARLLGVELDPMTARIAQYLYPDADILAGSFAEVGIPEGSVDLVIGNVPFGKVHLPDADHNPGRVQPIHNHFLLKSIALTRPGGLIALITSHHTADGDGEVHLAARQRAAEMADLVGAVRLPSNAHQRAAGTGVVTDLLIFRRRATGAAPAAAAGEWGDATRVTLPAARPALEPAPLPVNRYFLEHPEHVLGAAQFDVIGRGADLRVAADRPAPDALRDALASITEAAHRDGLTMADADIVTPPVVFHGPLSGEEGLFGISASGQITQVRGGVAQPYTMPPASTKAAAAAEDRELRMLIQLRKVTVALLDEEAAAGVDATPRMGHLRGELNRLYDSYVEAYGPIRRAKIIRSRRVNKDGTETEVRRRHPPRMGGFQTDPLFEYVEFLEDYNEDSGTAAKATIFRERVCVPPTPVTRVDSPADAVAVCLDRDGRVDLETVAGLLGLENLPEAREALAGLVYDEPGTGRLIPKAEYLSGNVREKLAEAEAAAEGDDRFAANVTALSAVKPRDLEPGEMDARLGSPWIDATYVQRFLREILEDDKVVVSELGGTWTVKGGDVHNVLASTVWGTKHRSAQQLAEAFLNNRTITVTTATSSGAHVKEQEESAAAQAKAEHLNNRFRGWLWADPTRATALTAHYNTLFNSLVPRSFDDEVVTAPGMSTAFRLSPHQVAAVARIRSTPNVGLIHPTGAGKTLEMIVGGMELVRLGLVSKPCYVVPKGVLGEFRRHFRRAYPHAKLLAADSADLTGDRRRKFIARCSAASPDTVILLSAEAFRSIPVGPDTERRYLEQQVAELEPYLKDAEGDSSPTVKDLETRKLEYESRLSELLSTQASDADLIFERMGIGYLFVDEVQRYKNRRVLSHNPQLSHPGNKITEDLWKKRFYLQTIRGQRRVMTVGSATPIDNSAGEILTLIKWLGPEHLAHAGLHTDEQALNWFVAPQRKVVMTADGSRLESRMVYNRLVNVPELQQLIFTLCDVKTKAEVNLKEPTIVGGEPEVITVPGTDALREVMVDNAARARALSRRTQRLTRAGEWKRDNILWISNDGRAASLDVRLAGKTTDEPQKVDVAAQKIYDLWAAHRDDIYLEPDGSPHPVRGSAVAAFCDLGVNPNQFGFSFYDALTDKLVGLGMPRELIRRSQDATNQAKKDQLVADAKHGRVGALLGSRQTLGTGWNVQQRLIAVVQIDATWKLSSIIQSLGRAQRQGNQNDQIHHIILITENSYEPFLWGKVDNKAEFPRALFDRHNTRRSLDIDQDDDGRIDTGVMFAIAAGRPELHELTAVQERVSLLSAERRLHYDTQAILEATIAQDTARIRRTTREVTELDEVLTRRTDTSGDRFHMSFRGRSYTKRAEAGAALRTALAFAVQQAAGNQHEERGVLTVGGVMFDLIADRREALLRLPAPSGAHIQIDSAGIGTQDPVGLIRQIENRISAGLDRDRAVRVEYIDRLTLNINRARAQVGQPFTQQDELDQQRSRLEELKRILDVDQPAETQAAGRPDGAASETAPSTGRRAGGATPGHPAAGRRQTPRKPEPGPEDATRPDTLRRVRQALVEHDQASVPDALRTLWAQLGDLRDDRDVADTIQEMATPFKALSTANGADLLDLGYSRLRSFRDEDRPQVLQALADALDAAADSGELRRPESWSGAQEPIQVIRKAAARFRQEGAARLPEKHRQRRGHDFYPPSELGIPALYSTEDTPIEDKVLYAHYFAGSFDCWIAEYDPQTGDAFAYTCLGDPANAEWRTVSLPELEEIRLAGALFVIERDLYWTPKPAREIDLPGWTPSTPAAQEQLAPPETGQPEQRDAAAITASTGWATDPPVTAASSSEAPKTGTSAARVAAAWADAASAAWEAPATPASLRPLLTLLRLPRPVGGASIDTDTLSRAVTAASDLSYTAPVDIRQPLNRFVSLTTAYLRPDTAADSAAIVEAQARLDMRLPDASAPRARILTTLIEAVSDPDSRLALAARANDRDGFGHVAATVIPDLLLDLTDDQSVGDTITRAVFANKAGLTRLVEAAADWLHAAVNAGLVPAAPTQLIGEAYPEPREQLDAVRRLGDLVTAVTELRPVRILDEVRHNQAGAVAVSEFVHRWGEVQLGASRNADPADQLTAADQAIDATAQLAGALLSHYITPDELTVFGELVDAAYEHRARMQTTAAQHTASTSTETHAAAQLPREQRAAPDPTPRLDDVDTPVPRRVTIEHHDAGTLVHGLARVDTARGSALHSALGKAKFRFSNNIGAHGAWYLPRPWKKTTRDRRVRQIAAAFTELGVPFDQQDTPPTEAGTQAADAVDPVAAVGATDADAPVLIEFHPRTVLVHAPQDTDLSEPLSRSGFGFAPQLHSWHLLDPTAWRMHQATEALTGALSQLDVAFHVRNAPGGQQPADADRTWPQLLDEADAAVAAADHSTDGIAAAFNALWLSARLYKVTDAAGTAAVVDAARLVELAHDAHSGAAGSRPPRPALPGGADQHPSSGEVAGLRERADSLVVRARGWLENTTIPDAPLTTDVLGLACDGLTRATATADTAVADVWPKRLEAAGAALVNQQPIEALLAHLALATRAQRALAEHFDSPADAGLLTQLERVPRFLRLEYHGRDRLLQVGFTASGPPIAPDSRDVVAGMNRAVIAAAAGQVDELRTETRVGSALRQRLNRAHELLVELAQLDKPAASEPAGPVNVSTPPATASSSTSPDGTKGTTMPPDDLYSRVTEAERADRRAARIRAADLQDEPNNTHDRQRQGALIRRGVPGTHLHGLAMADHASGKTPAAAWRAALDLTEQEVNGLAEDDIWNRFATTPGRSMPELARQADPTNSSITTVPEERFSEYRNHLATHNTDTFTALSATDQRLVLDDLAAMRSPGRSLDRLYTAFASALPESAAEQVPGLMAATGEPFQVMQSVVEAAGPALSGDARRALDAWLQAAKMHDPRPGDLLSWADDFTSINIAPFTARDRFILRALGAEIHRRMVETDPPAASVADPVPQPVPAGPTGTDDPDGPVAEPPQDDLDPHSWQARIKIVTTDLETVVTGTRGDASDKGLRDLLKRHGFRYQDPDNPRARRRAAPGTIKGWRYPGKLADQDAALAAVREWLVARDEADARAQTSAATFAPTEQQSAIIERFMAGDSLVVQALAGTGKTSTLQMLARHRPDVPIVYLAFNRSIAEEAREKFPRNVEARTSHSFAVRGLGRDHPTVRRMGSQSGARFPDQWAEALGIDRAVLVGPNATLRPDELAQLTMAAVREFRQSADPEISAAHVPATEVGTRSTVESLIVEHARAAWQDITSPDGRLFVTPDDVLKVYALTHPRLPARVVFFDEAQDINPVTDGIIRDNVADGTGAQLVVVGDSNQSIYGFRGAFDALGQWSQDLPELPLTQSWRFGQDIAQAGNQFLRLLESPWELTGDPNRSSSIGPVERPDAILTRTNAGAVGALFDALDDGREVTLVGGTRPVEDIANAARDLQAGRGTKHPELSRFKTWDDAVDFVEDEAGGPEAQALRPFVRLVNTRGADTLLAMAAKVHPEDEKTADGKPAWDLAVCTAHKAKGCEWDQVRIAGDFPQPKENLATKKVELPSAEERRLAYVAVTRGKQRVEPGSLAWVNDYAPVIPTAVSMQLPGLDIPAASVAPAPPAAQAEPAVAMPPAPPPAAPETVPPAESDQAAIAEQGDSPTPDIDLGPAREQLLSVEKGTTRATGDAATPDAAKLAVGPAADPLTEHAGREGEDLPEAVLDRHREAARRAGSDPRVVDEPEYRATLRQVLSEATATEAPEQPASQPQPAALDDVTTVEQRLTAAATSVDDDPTGSLVASLAALDDGYRILASTPEHRQEATHAAAQIAAAAQALRRAGSPVRLPEDQASEASPLWISQAANLSATLDEHRRRVSRDLVEQAGSQLGLAQFHLLDAADRLADPGTAPTAGARLQEATHAVRDADLSTVPAAAVAAAGRAWRVVANAGGGQAQQLRRLLDVSIHLLADTDLGDTTTMLTDPSPGDADLAADTAAAVVASAEGIHRWAADVQHRAPELGGRIIAAATLLDRVAEPGDVPNGPRRAQLVATIWDHASEYAGPHSSLHFSVGDAARYLAEITPNITEQEWSWIKQYLTKRQEVILSSRPLFTIDANHQKRQTAASEALETAITQKLNQAEAWTNSGNTDAARRLIDDLAEVAPERRWDSAYAWIEAEATGTAPAADTGQSDGDAAAAAAAPLVDQTVEPEPDVERERAELGGAVPTTTSDPGPNTGTGMNTQPAEDTPEAPVAVAGELASPTAPPASTSEPPATAPSERTPTMAENNSPSDTAPASAPVAPEPATLTRQLVDAVAVLERGDADLAEIVPVLGTAWNVAHAATLTDLGATTSGAEEASEIRDHVHNALGILAEQGVEPAHHLIGRLDTAAPEAEAAQDRPAEQWLGQAAQLVQGTSALLHAWSQHNPDHSHSAAAAAAADQLSTVEVPGVPYTTTPAERRQATEALWNTAPGTAVSPNPAPAVPADADADLLRHLARAEEALAEPSGEAVLRAVRAANAAGSVLSGSMSFADAGSRITKSTDIAAAALTAARVRDTHPDTPGAPAQLTEGQASRVHEAATRLLAAAHTALAAAINDPGLAPPARLHGEIAVDALAATGTGTSALHDRVAAHTATLLEPSEQQRSGLAGYSLAMSGLVTANRALGALSDAPDGIAERAGHDRDLLRAGLDLLEGADKPILSSLGGGHRYLPLLEGQWDRPVSEKHRELYDSATWLAALSANRLSIASRTLSPDDQGVVAASMQMLDQVVPASEGSIGRRERADRLAKLRDAAPETSAPTQTAASTPAKQPPATPAPAAAELAVPADAPTSSSAAPVDAQAQIAATIEAAAPDARRAVKAWMGNYLRQHPEIYSCPPLTAAQRAIRDAAKQQVLTRYAQRLTSEIVELAGDGRTAQAAEVLARAKRLSLDHDWSSTETVVNDPAAGPDSAEAPAPTPDGTEAAQPSSQRPGSLVDGVRAGLRGADRAADATDTVVGATDTVLGATGVGHQGAGRGPNPARIAKFAARVAAEKLPKRTRTSKSRDQAAPPPAARRKGPTAG